jgi:hypothetical protein
MFHPADGLVCSRKIDQLNALSQQLCTVTAISQFLTVTSLFDAMTSIRKSFPDFANPQLICPTSRFANSLSSPFCKNILVLFLPKSGLEVSPSRPARGAYRDRHERGAGCGGRDGVA